MTKKKQRALASGAMPSSSPPVQLPSQLPQLQAATDAHLCSRERQFSALAADVYVLPAALERTLWLHNVVLLLVQHTLLLDERVTVEQTLLPLWTVLWLGRAHLATCVDPLPILQQQRKQQARWRIGIAAASAVLQLAFLRYYATAPQFHTHVLVLLLVFALDAASVVLLSHADAQLTWPQVALAAVETPLLTSVFSVLYAHREFLIYDRVAFALVAMSASVHTAVLLSAKVAARSTAPRDGLTQWSQQRGRDLIASLRRAVKLEEEDKRGSFVEATKQKKKKKGVKSSLQPLLGTADVGHSEQEAQTLAVPSSHSFSKSLLQHASVRVAALAAVQGVLLLTQVVLSAFFLFSWELMSVVVLSSSHVLYMLMRLHEKLAAPPSVEPGSRLALGSHGWT